MSEHEIDIPPNSTNRDLLIKLVVETQIIKSEVKKTNGRLTKVERIVWGMIGAIVAIPAFLSLLNMLGLGPI